MTSPGKFIIPDMAIREEAGKSKLSSDALMDLNLDVLSKHKNIIRIAPSHLVSTIAKSGFSYLWPFCTYEGTFRTFGCFVLS